MGEVTFEAELYLWQPGDTAGGQAGSWVFLNVPEDLADEIEDQAGPRRGFGSVRVEVRIGGTTWRTSLFPSTAERTFVLPVKKAVRAAEGLEVGDTATVTLHLLEG